MRGLHLPGTRVHSRHSIMIFFDLGIQRALEFRLAELEPLPAVFHHFSPIGLHLSGHLVAGGVKLLDSFVHPANAVLTNLSTGLLQFCSLAVDSDRLGHNALSASDDGFCCRLRLLDHWSLLGTRRNGLGQLFLFLLLGSLQDGFGQLGLRSKILHSKLLSQFFQLSPGMFGHQFVECLDSGGIKIFHGSSKNKLRRTLPYAGTPGVAPMAACSILAISSE